MRGIFISAMSLLSIRGKGISHSIFYNMLLCLMFTLGWSLLFKCSILADSPLDWARITLKNWLKSSSLYCQIETQFLSVKITSSNDTSTALRSPKIPTLFANQYVLLRGGVDQGKWLAQVCDRKNTKSTQISFIINKKIPKSWWSISKWPRTHMKTSN